MKAMMKLHTVLLACALGAGTLLGVAAPASAARVYVATVRHPYYGPGYRYGYPYRYGYGYPYGVGVGVGYVGGGYGYVGGGYGYAPYPAVYGVPAYPAYRPYWHPYRRAYWGPRVIR
jgi:hypothetical protein